VSNTFILGLFTNNTIVGYYSAAEKLIAAVTAAFAPVSRTIYPYISKLSVTSKDRALQLIRRIERWVAVTGLLVSLALLTFAAPIVHVLFGSQYQASVIVVQIQAFLPCIIGVATVYANLFLLGFGYSAQWSRIIIVSSLLSIVLGISFIGILSLAHYGAAAARLVTECIVLSWSYLAYRRKVCYAHR
jgi:PST family polysaccharide transporter